MGYHKKTRSVPNEVYQKDLKNKEGRSNDEKITNKSVRLKFFNIKYIDIQIAKRRLHIVGMIVTMGDDKLPTRSI